MTRSIPVTAGASIKVALTYLAVSDFRRRNVFPMLREEHASRRCGNYFHFFITLDLAKRIKADVEEQYKLPTTTGAMRRSYYAVRHNMWGIIRAPEIEEENRQRAIKLRHAFKEKACSGARSALGLAKAYLIEAELCRAGSEPGKLRFDDETLCDFERVAAELEDILHKGEIRSDDDDDEEAIVAASAPACRADIPLQNFLKSVTSDLSLVEHEKPEGV